MTGRGTPRRAKSPEPKSANMFRYTGEHFSEEKQNGSTKDRKLKEREQKKPNHTVEKPSVQSMQKETTTKQSTKEINSQRTPRNHLNRAKATAARAKSPAKETKKIQPVKPKDTTKDSLKTTKARQRGKEKSPKEETPKEVTKTIKTTEANTCGSEAKPLVEFAQETETQLQKQKDARNDSAKSTKAKPCLGKTKSKEKFIEEIPKIQPERPEHTTNACVTQEDSILYTTLEKLKIRRNDRSNAAKVINDIKKHIIKHLKQNSECFKEVEEPLGTGSYYEDVKISNPDEFDLMLPIPVERVTIKTFGEDGAFYSVELKRGRSPLQKFQETGILSACIMLKEFREEVKKCVKESPEWEVTRKKKGCPAVTLTTKVESVTISLDVVLCLRIKSSWPAFTTEGLKINDWLGVKVKREYKRKPFYFVPKYEGRGTIKNDGVLTKDVWRISFSHIEKAILKNHGSEKTCCEKDGERCCRKDCLKLLKHLLSLQKERDSSFAKFCSYHAKTTLLHACCSRTKDSDWKASDLSQCFLRLLEDFICHLEKGELPNFFIPSQNLLSGVDQKSCNSLACRIREEHENGFSIFK
ncbi:Cyclic GMP-AMP synthase [Channa argus]|uniref:Cyclic GMP-AMP synthase n=1 Tax=Channa argus TaxID=215402 RepID=A0A6G1R0M1_CHAAH|nr:Cyclic GMP-AMP synthase [Channa argus]